MQASPRPEDTQLDRRTFVKAVSAAGVGLALGARLASAQATSAATRRRYAIVGTGGRHQMFTEAILGDYREHAELVGLCDLNPGRLELARARAAEKGGNPAAFAHTDFDRMIRETKPDTVIVTTVDGVHRIAA